LGRKSAALREGGGKIFDFDGGRGKRADVGIRPYGVEGTYDGLMEVEGG